jgi:aminoglycoside phosphotransferase (APT) family kinase protein
VVVWAAPELKADVERRVRIEIGLQVESWTRVSGGAQNRLFHLSTREGTLLLLKQYAIDRWPRLTTEFSTLRALNSQGLERVPRALLRDDERSYAVYSFEPGSPRPASELSTNDVEEIARFCADLHRFSPLDLGSEKLTPAPDASFSPAGQKQVILGRLGAFEAFASSAAAPDDLRTAHQQLGLPAKLDRLLADLVDDAEPPLLESAWRLSHGDFGPQNFLFTESGDLTVVDFEAAGWDDPAHMVMGFVAHAASEDLPLGLAELFLGAYAEQMHLSDAEENRYERVGHVLDVEWVAVYASALTAENMANKQSAVAGFDLQGYVGHVLPLIARRLARATAGTDYPFPR